MLAKSLGVKRLGAHPNASASPGAFVVVQVGHGVTVARFAAVIPTGDAVCCVADGDFFGFAFHSPGLFAGHATPEDGGAEELALLQFRQSTAGPLPCGAIRWRGHVPRNRHGRVWIKNRLERIGKHGWNEWGVRRCVRGLARRCQRRKRGMAQRQTQKSHGLGKEFSGQTRTGNRDFRLRARTGSKIERV